TFEVDNPTATGVQIGSGDVGLESADGTFPADKEATLAHTAESTAFSVVPPEASMTFHAVFDVPVGTEPTGLHLDPVQIGESGTLPLGAYPPRTRAARRPNRAVPPDRTQTPEELPVTDHQHADHHDRTDHGEHSADASGSQQLRDIAEVSSVEIITSACVHLMSAAAGKVGLTEDEESGQYQDLAEARKLIHALAGLETAAAPDIGTDPARSLRDGLRSLQLAFAEALPFPDAPGEAPGEKDTGRVSWPGRPRRDGDSRTRRPRTAGRAV